MLSHVDMLHSTQLTWFRFNVNGPIHRWRTNSIGVLSEKLIIVQLIIKIHNTQRQNQKKPKIQPQPSSLHFPIFLNNFHSFRIYRAFTLTQTYQTAYRRVCMKTASPTASNLVSSVAVLHPLRIPLHSSGNSTAVCLAISSCFRPSLKRLWR